MKKVLSEELKNISLSESEISELNKLAKNFIKSLNNVGLSAYVGGSLAKGTLVKKNRAQDVDIFVVFNYSEDISKLEGILKKIKLPGTLKKVHGSRDYFQIVCDNVLLEIIPVVKNKDPETAENITDISLSHVKYVSGEIKKNPKIADEIKLAKVFCQANRCYGAESYIRGFSGYSLEILVIYFGSFVKFLKGIRKKNVIDPLKYFKNEREVLREINASKLNGPLVVVDPTYKYRNVSAGLGLETFEKFLDIAGRFLKSPLLGFFEEKRIDIEEMKKFAKSKNAKFLEIDLKTDRQEGDIAGTKMKKFLDFFARGLVRKQQQVLKKEFVYSGSGKIAKGYLVVLAKPKIECRGPSVGLEDAVGEFKKAKGSRGFKKGKYWWYKEKVSIEGVFNECLKVSGEMGARGRMFRN